MTETDFDIAICGAGPVGLALGLLLVKRGANASRIALIDAKPLEYVTRDPRSIALSYGSTQILEQVGAWPVAADAIHQIHVSRRSHFGRTLIDRTEYGLPALGYVTRYGVLVSALATAAARTGMTMLRPENLTGSTEQADAVELHFPNRAMTTQILVQAEGGLFSDQSTKPIRRDYDQTAIVAHVTTSSPVAHRAFERFTEEGPLALLPQDDGYAMVWCMRPGNATRLLAMPDAAFLQELEGAFGTRVGRFADITPRAAFPLGLNAYPAATARTVAIGNAAQTLHPVAGQGLNLGLRDATVLARLLAGEATPDMLGQFVRARQSDRSMTITLTDTMARVFASAPDGASSQSLLGMSLALLDTLRPAKRLLAEHMLFGRRQ